MHLTYRFDAALALARELHRTQTRKGTEVPYLGHLLATCGLVMHFGGSETQAIAALLHDAAEDAGGRPTLERIRRRFGKAVATIVRDCTDTFERPKPPWRPRKEQYIDAIAKKPTASLLVAACDKLDNARAIVADLRRFGPRTLERFSGDPLWYYRGVTDALAIAGSGTPVADVAGELEMAVREMEQLARGSRSTARG